MSKSAEMEQLLNEITESTFGRSRGKAVCVTCGSTLVKPDDFSDDLSRKEFTISFMCQKCQDEIFGGN